MKKLVVLILTLVFAVGIAYASGPELAKKAGDYNISLRFDRTPSAGVNNTDIAVRDASGNYVTDAKVKVLYSMPAMPEMPAMNYKTDAVLTGSTYKATMNLSMSGAWGVSVKVTRGSRTSTAKFNVDAQ